MKRIFKGIAALSLAVTVFAGSTVSSCAMERSYTYNYDYWGDVQDSPDFYTVRKVFTSEDLGLEKKLKNPQGLYTKGNMMYICDTGNNRILQFERQQNESLKLIRIIDEITGAPSDKNTLSGPTDIAVSDEGMIFIADKGNERIIKVTDDLEYQLQFLLPNDSTLASDLRFQPSKIAIDTADRVYCVASGINKGLVKYENDGSFSGFVGATKVSFDFTDYMWKKIATQTQREKLVSFVPTEYDNLYMDKEGFVYACTTGVKEEDLRAEKAQPVRKLNLMGDDILVRNGEYDVIGDLYFGTAGGYEGCSRLNDITCLDNDVYVCLDRNRGRLFGYNDQGKLVFVFGGSGNMDGYFKTPSALDHMGQDLYVLDAIDCSVTMFVITEFGKTVYSAMEQFDAGEYEESGKSWQKAMDMNGNYDLAYIGIGRSLLRQEKYHEAMDYFELKYDDDNYSKAFKQYRKEWVEDHIGTIVVVLLLLFLIPMGIGKVKSIKHEIDIADIFRL